MNEERDSAQTPSTQGAPSQRPVGQTSAVNAGFDVTKLGGDKNKKSSKPKKVKNPKKEKIKSPDNNGLSQKSKRPLWFWLVLGILGIAILAVSIWAVVTLIHSSNDEGTTTSLVLDDNTNNDDGMGNEAVNNYVAQLQKIYNAGSDNGSDNAAGMEKVTQAVDNAVQSKQGEAQAGSIRIAAMVLAYQNSDYDKVISLTDEINLDELSLQDQITYYATLYAVYDSNGDTEKAQEAFRIEGEKIQQLCSKQECMQ